MKDWNAKLDDFLKFNEYQILNNYGAIKKKTADTYAQLHYDKFRPKQEAEHMSDFDKAVEARRTTGSLPSSTAAKPNPGKIN